MGDFSEAFHNGEAQKRALDAQEADTERQLRERKEKQTTEARAWLVNTVGPVVRDANGQLMDIGRIDFIQLPDRTAAELNFNAGGKKPRKLRIDIIPANGQVSYSIDEGAGKVLGNIRDVDAAKVRQLMLRIMNELGAS